jgi:hypothetical protein
MSVARLPGAKCKAIEQLKIGNGVPAESRRQTGIDLNKSAGSSLKHREVVKRIYNTRCGKPPHQTGYARADRTSPESGSAGGVDVRQNATR